MLTLITCGLSMSHMWLLFDESHRCQRFVRPRQRNKDSAVKAINQELSSFAAQLQDLMNLAIDVFVVVLALPSSIHFTTTWGSETLQYHLALVPVEIVLAA